MPNLAEKKSRIVRSILRLLVDCARRFLPTAGWLFCMAVQTEPVRSVNPRPHQLEVALPMAVIHGFGTVAPFVPV